MSEFLAYGILWILGLAGIVTVVGGYLVFKETQRRSHD